jgi:1,4-alpha-glucan branching enzyme
MVLVDKLPGGYWGNSGLGTIAFSDDAHGLGFDGSNLFEHPDRKGIPSMIEVLFFLYGRNEVRSFLISNALFWLQHYADALRVDTVASMLYLDYSRKRGMGTQYMEEENLDTISFKEFNEAVYSNFEELNNC